MISRTFSSLIRSFAVVAAIALTLPAFGQTARARVDIPFAFEATGQQMPAGQYSLERQSGSWQLTLTAPSGRQSAVLGTPTKSADNPVSSKIVFEKMGESYRLAEVHIAGAAYGLKIPASKTQIEIARLSRPERVEIALARR